MKRSEIPVTKPSRIGKPYPDPIDELQSAVARINLTYNADKRTIEVLREMVAARDAEIARLNRILAARPEVTP